MAFVEQIKLCISIPVIGQSIPNFFFFHLPQVSEKGNFSDLHFFMNGIKTKQKNVILIIIICWIMLGLRKFL